MLGIILFASACASHPRYGASPRHKRGCDCPKWNAMPRPAHHTLNAEIPKGNQRHFNPYSSTTNAPHH